MKSISSGAGCNRLARSAVGSVILAFGVAACGGGGSKAAAPTSSSSSAATTTTSAPATTVPATAVPPAVPPTTSAVTTSPAPTATVAAALPTATFGSWNGRSPSVIYFSGDSSNIVDHLTWSWTATEAVGNGTWTYESCVPDCATGPTAPYPASVTLSDPMGGQFTRGVERTTGPHAFTSTFTLPSRFITAS